jgi:hypothetical protein
MRGLLGGSSVSIATLALAMAMSQAYLRQGVIRVPVGARSDAKIMTFE